MTTYVSSSYSLSSVMFSYILAQMPRHSPQPVENSTTALRQEQRRVTSHHTVTSYYFQQRFRSNIRVTLHGHQFTLYCFPAKILCMHMWTKPWFPFHNCTWRYTRRLWYLAADDVGGRFSGCPKHVLVATFWWKRSNLNLYSVSPTAPVYRQTSAASPALDMSASVAFSCRKTSACVMKCLSERICFRASPLPCWIPEKLYHSRGWHEQTTYCCKLHVPTLFAHSWCSSIVDSSLFRTWPLVWRRLHNNIPWHENREAQADLCHRQPG